MPDKKISELPLRSAALASDELANAAGGTTWRTPISSILSLVPTLTPDPINTSYVSPEMFGGVGDGSTYDTVALTEAVSQAVAQNVPLRLLPGKTYLFTQLDILSGCVVEATGATLRSDGSLTRPPAAATLEDETEEGEGGGEENPGPPEVTGLATLRLFDDCRFDNLSITTPGNETNQNIVEIGAGVEGESLTVVSDANRTGGGILCPNPNNIRIGYIRTVNIDRPLLLYNVAIAPEPPRTTQATGTVIGFLDCTSYIRGFRADFCSFTLGGARMSVRSPNGVFGRQGQNGVLLGGCSFFKMGDLWIADSPEHAFRIGGSPAVSADSYNGDFQVGNMWVSNCGGCALKITPTLERTEGVTEKCRRGTFGFISAYNVGGPSTAPNFELLRLSHCFQFYIAGAYAQTGPDNVSAEYLLRINDCNGVLIGDLGGEGVARGFIKIDGRSDAAPPSGSPPLTPPGSFGGDVVNLRINRLWGKCHDTAIISGSPAPTNAIDIDARGFDATGAFNQVFNVGDITIGDCYITGWTGNMVNWAFGTPTGTFEINGRAYGRVPWDDGTVPVEPRVNIGAPDSVRANVRWGRDAESTDLPVFNEAFAVNNSGLPAAVDNHGGGLVMSRLASLRRGAAIVGQQFTSDPESFGLKFLVSGATTSSDALVEALRITHKAAIQIRDSVSAPDTATGWASIYVEGGVLKIRFGNGIIKTIATNA